MEVFHQKQHHLSHFVVCVDGLLRLEAEATLKRLTSRLSSNCQQPYSSMCGYVKSWVTITVVQAEHLCIRAFDSP